MSKSYDEYLTQHRMGVKKSFEFLEENLPDIFVGRELSPEDINEIKYKHDASKDRLDEYIPYDYHWYAEQEPDIPMPSIPYEEAWLLHNHRNPHHWQYWILHADEGDKTDTIFPMPFRYIIEMICDWWSFSWREGNLGEIFAWYAEHQDGIKIHTETRKIVLDILDQLLEVLEDRPSADEEESFTWNEEVDLYD